MIGFISTLVILSLLITIYYRVIADLHTSLFTVAQALGFSASTNRLVATDLNTQTITSNHLKSSCLLRTSCGYLPPRTQNFGTALVESESESQVTIDGQSASLSWNKEPIWGLRSSFYYCQTVAGLLMWGALPDERMCLSLQLLLALASAVIHMCESRGTRDHILLSQIRDFPFRCLLRLAGLRWRYSTLPPYGVLPWLSLEYRYITAARTT
jgi:hypothetical protein